MLGRLPFNYFGQVVVVEVVAAAVAALCSLKLKKILQGPGVFENELSLAFLLLNILRAVAAFLIMQSNMSPSRCRRLALSQGCFLSVLVTGGYVWHAKRLIMAFADPESWPDPEAGSSAPKIAELAIAVANVLYSIGWLAFCRSLDRGPAPERIEETPARPEVSSFQLELEADAGSPSCAICLDDLRPGCIAGQLPCGHVFHGDCIETWLLKGHRFARCPMRCEAASEGGGSSPPAAAEAAARGDNVEDAELEGQV